MDVGGTYMRIGLAKKCDNRTHAFPDWFKLYKRKITMKMEFIHFIKDVLNDLNRKDSVRRSVICFAGPLNERKKVWMTNWENTPNIRIEELYNCGLPVNHTLMLNDMEAAAYGLLHFTQENRLKSSECIPLFRPRKNTMSGCESKNMILLSPGKGLGTWGIVMLKTKTDFLYSEPIPLRTWTLFAKRRSIFITDVPLEWPRYSH